MMTASNHIPRWLDGIRAALVKAPTHRPRSHRRRHAVRPHLEPLEDRCVPSTMTVDGSQQFQTIDGFGTNLSSKAWNRGAVVPSLNTLLGHGYKLYRVIVEPVQGWEDTNPNTGQFSDSNPNWPYYNNLYGTSTKFTNLWNTIGYLKSHGATVWVNLQSDAPAWMTDSGGAPATIGPDHEADWATMVSTMVDYAVHTAHVHIDALGPMNEPDVADYVQGPQVGASQYVRMLDTLETQLQGYGLGNIPLVGPDTASAGIAVDSYVPAMLADPSLMPHVLQFGFHTYGGSVSDSAITNNSTYPGRHILSDEYDGPYYNEDHGQRATPTELWAQADASFQNLISIVNAGENGATIWDGVDNFYEYYQQWSAHGLISYDWTAPNPTAQSDYGTTPRLYANAQMFQFVHSGDIVIGISDNASNFTEVAFKDPTTGQITIVGENTGASSQSFTGNLVGGLNTSVFNLYYTNSSQNEQQQANVAVANKTFNFSVPADTIFTLTTPTSPSVTGVTPISGLTSGGQSVTITGSSFSGATSISFGGVAARSFTINSDTRITAVTPAHAAGAVDVTVAFPNGTSAISAADRFQYVAPNGTAPPTVASAASATLAGNQASVALSVLGASQYGAGTLTYTWATIGTPPAPVSFRPNGNNSASNVTPTFTHAGSYTFQVTITDPAGNTATSSTSVTVSQMARTLTVSPKSGAVTPNGTLQFSGTAKDQFGKAYASPIFWTVNGGGTIDSTGKFTAGSATGGPFTVTASVGSLSSTATVTISNTVNLAPSGTASRWWNLAGSTSDANRVAAPGLNDNNLANDVVLSGGGNNGQGDDNKNAYEAAGIIWGGRQSITRVTFTNGSFSPTYDGVFDANFGLQVTTDGTTWSSASAWTFTPAYAYNTAAAASKTYTFTGPALTILGARVVGQVHTSDVGNNSWYDTATEVQVFGTPAPAAATHRFSNASRLGPSAIGSFAGTGIPSASFSPTAEQLLSAITIASSTAGAYTIRDGIDLPVSGSYAANSPLVVKTRWPRAARTITLSTGSNAVIDDILYNK
jgi:O-glycosyl hydrolase